MEIQYIIMWVGWNRIGYINSNGLSKSTIQTRDSFFIKTKIKNVFYNI
jgi:hypothetical protein